MILIKIIYRASSAILPLSLLKSSRLTTFLANVYAGTFIHKHLSNLLSPTGDFHWFI